jgi:hypothetical protein
MNLGDSKDILPGSRTETMKVVVKAVEMLGYRWLWRFANNVRVEELATAPVDGGQSGTKSSSVYGEG